MIYKKYFNTNELNFVHIVNGASDTAILAEKEIRQIIRECKKILKDVYGIEIIKNNPIMIKEVN